MNTVLVGFLAYSVFYLFNYTDISSFIREPLLKKFNISKTRSSEFSQKVLYTVIYPLFCSYCFGFWFALFYTKSLTAGLISAIVSTIINNEIKKHGK